MLVCSDVCVRGQACGAAFHLGHLCGGGGGDAGADIVVKLELKLEYLPSCPRLWSQSTHKGVGNMCGVAQQTVTKSAGGHVKDMCGTAQQAMTKSASGR